MKRSVDAFATSLLVAMALAGCGDAQGRAPADTRPSDDQVASALLKETEACRRGFPGGGAVFTGPVRGTGVRELMVDGRACLEYGFEVPVYVSRGHSPESGVLPLRGDVRFVRTGGGWIVDERHRDFWRRSGVQPYSPENLAP